MKLIVFDTETTGIDTENDRIITCFIRSRTCGGGMTRKTVQTQFATEYTPQVGRLIALGGTN